MKWLLLPHRTLQNLYKEIVCTNVVLQVYNIYFTILECAEYTTNGQTFTLNEGEIKYLFANDKCTVVECKVNI